LLSDGKELFEKKLKKNKLHINDDALLEIVQRLHYKDLQAFYFEIALVNDKANEVIEFVEDKSKLQQIDINSAAESSAAAEAKELESIDRFRKQSQDTSKNISLGSINDSASIQGIKYDYAKCCNPIPGDDVIGFVTLTEGIKIHRKNCNNIINLYLLEPERIVEINWGETKGNEFVGGIKIIGENKPGILNELTETLSKNFKLNIRSLNIFTKGSMFEGTMIIEIENLKQLNSVIEKINNQKGIFSASRFYS
jgi:(p)ppGpp synthase/HD superfamily hydrolase